MKKLGVLGFGAVAILGISVAQIILPFAFDFLSTLAVAGVGFFAGIQYARADQA